MFHPKLCYGSLNYKECLKERCSFTHLQGTQRKKKENDSYLHGNNYKDNYRFTEYSASDNKTENMGNNHHYPSNRSNQPRSQFNNQQGDHSDNYNKFAVHRNERMSENKQEMKETNNIHFLEYLSKINTHLEKLQIQVNQIKEEQNGSTRPNNREGQVSLNQMSYNRQ
jgi:hypothetical protein